MPSIKLVASLLAVSAIATCLDDLDDHLAKLRQNPSDIPEAQRIVALGGGEQAKLSMQAALRAAIEQPDGNYLVNRSSAISFALLIGVDRTNQAALGYLRKRAEEAADLTAPVAFIVRRCSAQRWPSAPNRPSDRFSRGYLNCYLNCSCRVLRE